MDDMLGAIEKHSRFKAQLYVKYIRLQTILNIVVFKNLDDLDKFYYQVEKWFVTYNISKDQLHIAIVNIGLGLFLGNKKIALNKLINNANKLYKDMDKYPYIKIVYLLEILQFAQEGDWDEMHNLIRKRRRKLSLKKADNSLELLMLRYIEKMQDIPPYPKNSKPKYFQGIVKDLKEFKEAESKKEYSAIDLYMSWAKAQETNRPISKIYFELYNSSSEN